jgi:putative membrane protein
MLLRWIIATLHLLALPLGLGAVLARARGLRNARGVADLSRAFVADNLWALAAGVWIVTGLWRAFGGLEKGTEYYVNNRVFYVKMGLLALILLLEVLPMTTLVAWRIALRRGKPVDIRAALTLARISHIQAAIVILMVFAATALARGFFYG